MALILRDKNAELYDVATVIAPVVSGGLLAWHFLGNNAERSQRNFADGSLGTLSAAVTSGDIHDGYASLGGVTKYLTTNAYETNELTIIVAFRTSASLANQANDPILAATFDTTGQIIWVRSSGTRMQVTDATAAQWATLTDPAVTTWGCYAQVVGPTTLNAYDLTRGVTGTPDTLAGARVLKSHPYRIGASYSAVFGGAVDIAFCAIYNRALSLDELQAVRKQAAAYSAERGIIY